MLQTGNNKYCIYFNIQDPFNKKIINNIQK